MEKRRNNLWLTALHDLSEETTEETPGALDMPNTVFDDNPSQPSESPNRMEGLRSAFERDWGELKGMLMLTAVKQLKVDAEKHIETYNTTTTHEPEAIVIDIEDVNASSPRPAYAPAADYSLDAEVNPSLSANSGLEHRALESGAERLARELSDVSQIEGPIRLIVKFDSCVKEFMNFVQELNRNPRLRLLRLVGRKYGAEISLTVREASTLDALLPEVEGISISSELIMHNDSAGDKLISVRITRAHEV